MTCQVHMGTSMLFTICSVALCISVLSALPSFCILLAIWKHFRACGVSGNTLVDSRVEQQKSINNIYTHLSSSTAFPL